MLCAVGDDFFYAPPGQGSAGQPQQPAPHAPVDPGPAPGMPGYSGYQHEQVWAQVRADAPPSLPLSSANVVAGVAVLGGLLMVVGSWGPWIKVGVFGFSETVGGLHDGLNGRYVLALAIAVLLTGGTAMTAGQESLQVRQVCAGVLVALGVVGLGIVIHDWVTVSDQVARVNSYTDAFRNQATSEFGASSQAQTLLNSFDGFHVSRAWGLMVSGVASAIAGLAGAYLFLVKEG